MFQSSGIFLCRNRPVSFRHFAWTIVSFKKREPNRAEPSVRSLLVGSA